jgi:hypothetical protein
MSMWSFARYLLASRLRRKYDSSSAAMLSMFIPATKAYSGLRLNNER